MTVTTSDNTQHLLMINQYKHVEERRECTKRIMHKHDFNDQKVTSVMFHVVLYGLVIASVKLIKLWHGSLRCD